MQIEMLEYISLIISYDTIKLIIDANYEKKVNRKQTWKRLS